ncbi:nicotinate phosphoribosyltransferase [Limimonas halophila]|uniref:Nicotinate phosphoribosyltransferase n=1 Tax=Limimonas halophila TaxID=1082479 RepID=A0A1G7L9X7_9PROT|nr:nicotinate phosphoribosyltransferase [Limimonas halophila]SDF46186.1 nicotinate phosphoribosyltransferase [Limimonas halophila]
MIASRHTSSLANGLLLTDLYQLNMVQAYLDAGMTDRAVFEFFVRDLPGPRNFMLAAGLEQALAQLERVRLNEDELAWLRDSGRFNSTFMDYMADLRFDGEVHAMPEGTAVFPNEPVLRVSAPLPVAQLLETRLINLLHTSMVVASKAARMTLAAPGKNLVDFGLRRAHGAEAGLLGARASYIAGFNGTATVPAQPLWGIPITGTMAHSFIEAHTDEEQAFLDFARSRPNETVFLIDTYDTEAAAKKVVRIAPTLAAEGIKVHGVRIDSGDLNALSHSVRRILDDGGLSDVPIIASGGLDEWRLRDCVDDEVPIDGFGIGTALTTSEDAPALNCAYKLQEYQGHLKRKLSEGKETWPGRKQVWRDYDASGVMQADILGFEDEDMPGTPLLQPVMRDGAVLEGTTDLEAARERAARELAALPPRLQELEPADPYPVRVSERLQAEAERLAHALRGDDGAS